MIAIRTRSMYRVTTGILALAGLGYVLVSSAQNADRENIILGRPTADSVAIHALVGDGTRVFAEFGTAPGAYSETTDTVEPSADNIAAIELAGLSADTRYFYRLTYQDGPDAGVRTGDEHSFHTQRSRGSTFTFGVQGDSHPERPNNMYHPELYRRTMGLVGNARPDLYFMLGDDFSISNPMADFYRGDDTALNQGVVDDVYLNQRQFLSTMAHSTALFMVNGNHEEARRHFLDTGLHDVSIFAGRARTRFFPLPAPDGFYSGNPDPVEGIGLLRDYFAFEWGDALFVMIDPYWHSPVPVGNSGGMAAMGAGLGEEWNRLTTTYPDRWASSMGDAQYQWFRETLAESDATYKFVFTHHVLGVGRGGIELASNYEWGGYGADGTWEFDERRPGWELPVHQTMVKYGVTIFFQAHDHIFVHQELDGIVYQSVPNPADDTYTARNRDAYLSGDALDNSGYLNVTASPQQLQVDYIRSWLPQDETDGRRHGEVAYSYSVEPRYPPAGR
ncbi:MAG TPA: fibronectin type III domain-containing protein [Gammaproteobacteria bacterium]